MTRIGAFAAAWLAALLCWSAAHATDLEPAMQAKVSAKTRQIQAWAAEAAIVDAVKAYNAGKSAQAASMDQSKWQATSVIDPYVRGLTKTPAAELLKNHRRASGEVIAEAFLSGADGGKVAFLGKPSSWSHQGKDKHDEPMSGRIWQGEVEIDASSGLRQVQVAVPVLDGRKPIGSLVVGLSLNALAQQPPQGSQQTSSVSAR
ncbi:hypothetical protein JM946_22740 [Steroidobacter sp. S1-65]|uniref:Cache domain-containing protein n=1 Tax=Steroidobacter gossypii TaxID=2805490 RepID=A0ABS1X2W6_9GAMM|nr:hypothetical protein [Steroidobacter gossypii]MBM0107569.1 hypothetical protein [Steroidobacter gossypii]